MQADSIAWADIKLAYTGAALERDLATVEKMIHKPLK